MDCVGRATGQLLDQLLTGKHFETALEQVEGVVVLITLVKHIAAAAKVQYFGLREELLTPRHRQPVKRH